MPSRQCHMRSFEFHLITPACHTYPLSGPSNRTSINGVLQDISSRESIQSQEGSISNFSVHSTTVAIHKDLFDLSGQGGTFLPSHTTFRTHPVAKIPPFLITNIFTLSRNRLSVSEINLCLLYPPSASPNPTVVPLQLPRRAFCLLRMRPSPPSFPWVPLHNLPGPLLGSLLPWKYPPTIHPPSHLSIYFHAKPITWAPHALVRAWSPSGKHRLLRKSTLRRVCALYAHLSLLSPTN